MTSKWVFLFAVVGFLKHVRRTEALDVKTWRMDTNFNNLRNWEGNRLPCSNDRVIFPATPVLVFMPDVLSVAEVVLPMNGELVFPHNGVINITGGTQKGLCRGQDAKFKPTTDYWYDPNNWNITSIRAFPRLPSRRNAAVPHAYQVPCATDIVQFSANSSFKVHTINPTTRVAFLHINNIQYSQDKFDNLLATPVGRMLFPGSPDLKITHSTCTDETGCICGNEESSILQLICQFKDPCPAVDCQDPINVVGHCCPMCAAKIIVKRDNNFRMEQLLQLHENFHNKAAFSRVESFTSKTILGDIQSIFVDDTGANKVANQLANLIYKTLNEDADGARSYGISSIEIFKSTRWSDSGYDAYTSGISSGGKAAIVIVILISVGFAMAFYLYKKRQIPGFSFARFDLHSDRIELELGTTPHDELEPDDSAEPLPSELPEEKSKGFDNPIYGTNVSSEAAPPIIEDLPENKNFVENPMFVIFEDSTREES